VVRDRLHGGVERVGDSNQRRLRRQAIDGRSPCLLTGHPSPSFIEVDREFRRRFDIGRFQLGGVSQDSRRLSSSVLSLAERAAYWCGASGTRGTQYQLSAPKNGRCINAIGNEGSSTTGVPPARLNRRNIPYGGYALGLKAAFRGGVWRLPGRARARPLGRMGPPGAERRGHFAGTSAESVG